MVNEALELKIDFTADAGYLRYRVLDAGSHVTRTQRISDDVFVDFDADSRILGIEILGLDGEAIGAAARFAEANKLIFPDILTRGTRAPA